jgi:hypothetical protein
VTAQPSGVSGVVCLVLRTLLLSIATVLALAAPAAASTSQYLTFEAPRELFNDSLRDTTLDELDGLGVDALRVIVYWRNVAPAAASRTKPAFTAEDPNAYPAAGWAPYDRILEGARARGMKVILTVSGPVPRWATKSKRDQLTRPSSREFQRFMTAIGTRYASQISTWSIWNEPNHPDFLKPQYGSRKRPLSPRIYRALFSAADRGLRASGNGRDTVLMGETAPIGTGKVVTPIAFLRGALCLSTSYRRSRSCGKLGADGYAHHAYTPRQGPTFKHRSANNVTIGTLSRLTRALDRAGRAGAVRKAMPVYLTEFGVQSKPDRFTGVSLAQQAEFIAISERIAYRNRRVRAFSQYLMRDDDPVGGQHPGFESGLRFADGRVKPSYGAFRTPLVAARGGSKVTLWGLVRPAGGATTVELQYANRGSSRFRKLKSKRTNSRGYFSTTSAYRSGRRYRVVWRAPDGATHTGPPIRSYR